jgi:hypothetical protein
MINHGLLAQTGRNSPMRVCMIPVRHPKANRLKSSASLVQTSRPLALIPKDLAGFTAIL